MPKLPKLVNEILDQWDDILILLAVAGLSSFLVRRLLNGLKNIIIERMNKRGDASALDVEKNVKTIEAVLGRTLSFMIWGGAVIAILHRLKVDTSAFVTGAGIVGVAVGFGSQTLIKDVIAGLFMLIENQIRVNDAAMINGVAGTVEEVNLRTTVIRAENGGLHIFPNGSITALANLSRGFAHYVFEFTVAQDTNPDKGFEIMNSVIEQMRKEDPYKSTILAPLEIHGVDRILEQGIVLRGRLKTTPHKQWAAGREANKRILAEFERAGIQIASREWNIRMDGGGEGLRREELKVLIREVLRDEGTPAKS